MINQIVVTEKSAILRDQNCYTFIVDPNVNKIELRKYIELAYGVKVIKINLLKSLGKKVRRGRVLGRTSNQRKAYVFTSSKIEVLEEAK